jgi:hypothetical protein
MLWSLGMTLDEPALMLGDNMSVVFNTTVPSSVLKKNKHNEITYHQERDAIAVRIMTFAYINSEESVNDVLAKPLSNEKFHHLSNKRLFQLPEMRK